MEFSKFSMPEIIIALMITLILDGLDLLFGMAGLDFLLTPLELATTFFIAFWIWIKSSHTYGIARRFGLWILQGFAELVPVIGILPIRTVAMIAIIIMFNKEAARQQAEREKEQQEQEEFALAA